MHEADPETVRLVLQQAELASDVAAVANYGESVERSEWGGCWFDNARDPVALVVAVTDHVDEHAHALRDHVQHPERIDIVGTVYSEQSLRELQDQVLALRNRYPISAVVVDVRSGVVSVGFSVDDPVARTELSERFGSRIRVEAGVWTARAV